MPGSCAASLRLALRRARTPILAMLLAQGLGLVVGVAMAHGGAPSALDRRDRIVGAARAIDPAAIALRQGHRWRAAAADFAGNLGYAAVPTTVLGLGVVLPYPVAAYRGWVGGIVSVDDQHRSRLREPREALYYVLVVVLQSIPYALAGGAGVRVGLGLWPPRAPASGPRRPGLPRETLRETLREPLRDVARIYALVVPLLFVASLVEFLAR